MAARRGLARGLQAWGRGLGSGLPGVCPPEAQGGAAAAAALAQRCGLAPLGAAAGARPYAGSALEKLQEAAHKVRSAAATSAGALRAAGDSVSRAPGAIYRHLPTSAQQLVNAAQSPGAVNRVLSLQLTAFWQNHSNTIVGVGAAAACYGLWRALIRTSQLFVDHSDALAASGLLALAASSVAGGYLFLRRRYTIDPAGVYRLAMYRLNTHPGLLEIMGAPLVGSSVQASVLTGGGLHFKGLRPRLQSKRVQMIFPLKGSERRGLVSLEAKKRHGALRVVLLAVDVPCAAGGEQRIYLEGGPALYERGGVLGELREPFIRALSMDSTFMAEDEAEEAAEAAEREAAAAARASAAAARAAERRPKPLDAGGGMYFWERAVLWAKRARAAAQQRQQQAQQPLARPAAAAAGEAAGEGGTTARAA